MPTTRNDIVPEALYAQIQRRMVESGEWDRIRSILAGKLNEAGWVDNLHHKSKEMARDLSSISARRLSEELDPVAQTSVPQNVKDNAVALIRQFLETQIEK
ncbi:transcription factor e(y)2-domain-containing protein [Abortiporus biennis]|nr:transcription factor e(y)2-domain-containing protein [Abortiporus biennis]